MRHLILPGSSPHSWCLHHQVNSYFYSEIFVSRLIILCLLSHCLVLIILALKRLYSVKNVASRDGCYTWRPRGPFAAYLPLLSSLISFCNSVMFQYWWCFLDDMCSAVNKLELDGLWSLRVDMLRLNKSFPFNTMNKMRTQGATHLELFSKNHRQFLICKIAINFATSNL